MDHAALLHTIRASVPARMSAARWAHTERVRETALTLADRCGADPRRVETAALLHDCAKEWKEPRLEDLAARGEIAADGFTLRTPALHHTVVGCWLAREEYGIDDEEILEAIRYHATGAPGMGAVAQTVYLADYLEPGRGEPQGPVRQALERGDFNALLDAVAVAKLEYNLRRGRPVHPLALAWYNERSALGQGAAAPPRTEYLAKG